jgi:hypothetical protein
VALISIGLTSLGGWRNIALGFEQALLSQDWLLNFSCAAFGAGKSLQVVADLRVCGFRFEQSLIQ